MSLDLLKDALSAALEERSDGAMQIEDELVYYARIDVSKLPATPHREKQEQWSIKIEHTDNNAAKGDIRVRKTDFYDDGDLGRTEYVLTTKVRREDGKVPETPIVSTQDQFEHFKLLADNGMIKERWTYPINGTDMKWEVDLFINPQGGFFPWVKIDLELPENHTGGVPELPFEPEEIITAQNGKRTASEEAQVRELYETMFLTKNPGAASAQRPEASEEEQQGEAGSVAATENQKVWLQVWPELEGKPAHPDITPGDEIYESKDGQVHSEPDENRPVDGTQAALEVIQEFNTEVETLAQKMQVRLMHLSLGQGYVKPSDLYAQLADKSPQVMPVEQGGPFGSQYYYVKNPSPGAIVAGVGWHFNKPTLSSDQVQF